MKVYVLVAWILDTVHEALLLASIYVYLVKDIGDPSVLVQVAS